MTQTNKKLKAPQRVPPSFNGIQVNVCRNSNCKNFGNSPLAKVNRGAKGEKDGYRIIRGWGGRMLYCSICGKSFQLKSNIAVNAELDRITLRLKNPLDVCCKNSTCRNSNKTIAKNAEKYRAYGCTEAGAKRYQCKNCLRTFSVNLNPTKRQRTPEINSFLLRCLINKVPMRRMCELVNIRPATLYHRLEFFRQQCNQFAMLHEQDLYSGKIFNVLRISVDRQDYVFNWSSQFDRRNTQLSAIASVDNGSSFVFGMHLDFDPNIDCYEAELHAREIEDASFDPAYRTYARIFLPESDPMGIEKLPSTGVRVRSEYTMFAHFLFLKKLLPGASRIHFYLDRDPNIDAAAITAFQSEIKQGIASAFFVKINKDMTIDQRKLAMASRQAKLKREGKAEWKSAQTIIERQLVRNNKNSVPFKEAWVEHPLPNMGEPEKAVLLLTPTKNVENKIKCDEYLYASLNGVDRYFMQLRRRLSLLERPISSSASSGRVWHGTSPYNPEVAERLIQIFRVVYNYTLAGKDKKTPAMRLGLTDRVHSIEELLAGRRAKQGL